ncbi:hypothetical protein N7537_004773 [Penicillium hordei]|uniref:Uncharacterized protein n=1 Tax=Penicillium hordei TaxID=40994 RepID=A0AAD6EC50_9EURO|nr:uncharacterized protein N7537_004773 [Penicillium hordei]KAJ5608154.1 hypothetical protein N7537_004773 [Penicillium hordei]
MDNLRETDIESYIVGLNDDAIEEIANHIQSTPVDRLERAETDPGDPGDFDDEAEENILSSQGIEDVFRSDTQDPSLSREQVFLDLHNTEDLTYQLVESTQTLKTEGQNYPESRDYN